MNRCVALEQHDEPANETPEESDFEGFGNYTAAEAFIQGLAGMVNQNDVETMIRAQKQMLQRFEKTNEMISNCNALSQSRLKGANEDFKKHVKLLTDMKKDLDYIFRKIRVIKQKLNQQYPVAYAEAQRSSLAEEAEDEMHSRTPTFAASTSSIAVATATATATAAVAAATVAVDDASVSAAPADGPSPADGPADAPVDGEGPAALQPQAATTTVEYVQMEEAIENGKPIENELIKRVCSIETANPNDSSDCTSEDTG